MVSSERLLLFCDFLENRLHTSGLELLRRMVTDFSAGNEHTLQDFMRLGASVVSVMPVERTGPRHSSEAARLLAEQQADNDRNDDVPSRDQHNGDNLCFFLYLYARVATKNILLLRDMFRDFCQGDDAVLREFVRCAYAAIVVIPVDVRALCMARLPPPPLAAEAAPSSPPTTQMEMSSPAAPSPRSKRSRGPGIQQEADSDEYGANKGRARKKARHMTTPSEAVGAVFELDDSSLPENDVRTSILTVFKRLEAKEPWKEIFKPENLSMPFSRVRHPELYSVLKQFWLKHGRAVWERNFWAPLSRERTRELHNNRRCRQISAVNCFEKKMIIPVYKKLGASFFVAMDARAPRNGWFYFDQAIDLFTLAQRYGLSTCLGYIESQAFKRFPEAPGQSRRFVMRGNGKSRSMWSSSERLKPILTEIEAYEAKSSNSSNPPSSQPQ